MVKKASASPRKSAAACRKSSPPEALIKAIRQAVAEACQEAPSVVVLLNPRRLAEDLQRQIAALGLP
jgi:type II secretory pathway component PulC